MTDVVRDDRIAAGGYSQFNHQIVIRVGQTRPPQKEDRLSLANGTEVIKNIPNGGWTLPQLTGLTKQHLLILENQRHGKGDLKPTQTYGRQNRERCSAARTHRRRQDVAVENNRPSGPHMVL